MKIADAAAIRALDASAIAAGTPGIVLMERAAEGLLEAASQILAGVRHPLVLVACGKGNNGGDGLAAARLLARRKVKVSCLFLFSEKEYRGDARINLRRLKKEKVRRINGTRGKLPEFSKFDLIIDAIFGTGFSGRPEGRIAQCIRAMNASGRPVLSADIPSGVDASSGKTAGEAVRARATVTFGLPKLGHFFYPGRGLTGGLQVKKLGYPPGAVEKTLAEAPILIDKALARLGLPRRRGDEDKRACGRVLVVAGSTGLTGAACLAAHAALKSGAGLVTVCVPRSLNTIFEIKLTEEMTYPLEDRGAGRLSERHSGEILGLLKHHDTLILGPGVGRHPSTQALARRLVLQSPVPVVLDADGLFAFTGRAAFLKKARAPLVITPHAGEFERLTGLRVPLGPGRIEILQKAMARLHSGVVLKGAPTLVAFSRAEIYLNPTGNPGMATAGAGDVLAGLAGGLCARCKNLKQAVLAAVYLHGRSGDAAARELGEDFLTAQNLIDFLPQALKEILG